jgi:S1-C subfamily serine protease
MDGRTILTAFHLVGDVDSGTPYPALEILVGPFKGYTLRASVIATDPDNDLAVLRVERRPDFTGFAFLPMADSDTTPLGEPIYLLSYPLRPEGGLAVTRGNLLGIVRERASDQRVGFITDATASPGSSGGVAINGQGEVLGIITQGFFVTNDMGRPDMPPVSRLTGIVPINVARPTLDRAAGQ